MEIERSYPPEVLRCRESMLKILDYQRERGLNQEPVIDELVKLENWVTISVICSPEEARRLTAQNI